MGKSKLPQLRGSSGERETKDEEKKMQHPKEREGMKEKWLRWTGRSSKKQSTPTRDKGGGEGRAKSAPPVAADSNSSSIGGAGDADEMVTDLSYQNSSAGDKLSMQTYDNEQHVVRNGDGFYSDFIPINMVNYQIPHTDSVSPRDDVKNTGSGNGLSNDAVSNYSSGDSRVRSTPPSTLTSASAVKGPIKAPPSWPLPVPKVADDLPETGEMCDDVAVMLTRQHYQLYSHLRERSLSPTAMSPNTAVYAEISEIMAYKRQLGDAVLSPDSNQIDYQLQQQQYPQYNAHQQLYLQQPANDAQFQQMQVEIPMEDTDLYHQQPKYREHYDLQMQQYNAQELSQGFQQQHVTSDHNALYISTSGADVGDYVISRDASLKRAGALGNIYSPRVASEDSAAFVENPRRDRPTSVVSMGNASPTLSSRPSCGVTMARLRATRHIYSDVESTYGYSALPVRQPPSAASSVVAQQQTQTLSNDVAVCYDAGSQCDDVSDNLHVTGDVTFVDRHSPCTQSSAAIYHSEPVYSPDLANGGTKINADVIQLQHLHTDVGQGQFPLSSSVASVKRTSGTQTTSSMAHIYRAMASQTHNDVTGRPPKSSIVAPLQSSTRRCLPSVTEEHATMETAKMARATRSSPLQLQGYAPQGHITKVKIKVKGSQAVSDGSESSDSERSGLNGSSLDSSDEAAKCRRQKKNTARNSNSSSRPNHQGQGYKDKSRSKPRHSTAGKHRKHHSNTSPSLLTSAGARSASLTDSDEERDEALLRHQHHRLSLGHVTPDFAAATAGKISKSRTTHISTGTQAALAAQGHGYYHHNLVPINKEIDSEESISDAYAREDANRRLLHMTNSIYAPALVKPYSSSIRAVHFTGTTTSTRVVQGQTSSSTLAPRCDLIPEGSDLIIELINEEGSDIVTPVDFDPERNILNQPLPVSTLVATSPSIEEPNCSTNNVLATTTTAISTCSQSVSVEPSTKVMMQAASLSLNRSLTNPDVTLLPVNLQGDSRSCSVGVETKEGVKQQDLSAGSRLSESGYDSWKSQDSSSTVCTADDGRNCLSMRRRDFRSAKSPDSYYQQQQQQYQFLSVDRRNRYYQSRSSGNSSKGVKDANSDGVENASAKSISPVSPVFAAAASVEGTLDLDADASKLLDEMEKYTSTCDIMPKTSAALTFSTHIAQALEDDNEKDSGDSVRSSYENKQTFKDAIEISEHSTNNQLEAPSTSAQQNGSGHHMLQKSASNDEDIQWHAIRATSSLSTLNCAEESKNSTLKNAAELLTAGSRASLYEHLCEDQLERMSLFNGSCDSFQMNTSDMESSIEVSKEADLLDNAWNVDDVVVPDVTPTVELVPILTPSNQSTPVKSHDVSATSQQLQSVIAAAAKRPTTVPMSPRTGVKTMVPASSTVKDNDKTPVAETPETTQLPNQQHLQQAHPPSTRMVENTAAPVINSVSASSKSAHHQTPVNVSSKHSHFGFSGKNVGAAPQTQGVTENVSHITKEHSLAATAQPSVENVTKTKQQAKQQSPLLLPDRIKAGTSGVSGSVVHATSNSQRRKLPTEPPSPAPSSSSVELQQQKMQHRSASPRVTTAAGQGHPSSKIATPSPTTKPKSAGTAFAKQQTAAAASQQLMKDGRKSGSRQDLRSNSGSRQDLRSNSVDETRGVSGKQATVAGGGAGSKLAQAAKRSSLVGPQSAGAGAAGSTAIVAGEQGTLVSSAERQQNIKSPMPMPQLKKALHAPSPSNIPFAGRSVSLSPSFHQSPPASPMKRTPPQAVTSSPVHGRSANSRIPSASRDGSATNRHASNTATPPPPSPTPSTSSIAQHTRSSTTNNSHPLKPSGLRKTFAAASLSSSRKNSAS